MKMFPEENPNSVTVQLGFTVEEIHLDGLELTCISTIPAFLGHHARHSQYADHRAHSIRGKHPFFFSLLLFSARVLPGIAGRGLVMHFSLFLIITINN